MSARQQMPERETCDRRFLTYKVKIQGNDVKTQDVHCLPLHQRRMAGCQVSTTIQ